MQDYHQLDIWNRAMDYAVAIYQFVATSGLTASPGGYVGAVEHR